ncbi:MAG: hypothetical protein ABI581_03510 [Sediminibacterium sp.]
MKGSYKLNQQQFEYIAEQSDAILEKYSSNIYVTGIAWLHVLNSHPANQVKYIHVFYKRSFLKKCVVFLVRAATILRDLFLSLFSFSSRQTSYKTIPEETEVLIMSHLVNAAHKQNDPDFYFQDLPSHLAKKGYSTSVALLNHVNGLIGWNDNLKNEKDKFFVCLLPSRLDFGDEFTMICRCLRSSLFFLRQSFLESDPVKKSFLSVLAANALSVDTLRAHRIRKAIQYMLSHTRCTVLAFTWEGHSWERLLCHASRNANRKIISIGYQHTILFPSSHALKRSMGNLYNPDVILTVGSVTKNIIESSFGSGKTEIKEYGSPRLTQQKKYQANVSIRNACLVAPEGLVQECIVLFMFGIEVAKLAPETHFIFRTHPTVHFTDLQLKDERLCNLPSNVIISTNKNIDDDFNRSSWLLYRSSSVSFFAIQNGLRPVYLQSENELSIDPLYKLNSWRFQVNKPGEMVSIIENDIHTEDTDRREEIKEAIVFSNEYMKPYDVDVFEAYIRNANK